MLSRGYQVTGKFKSILPAEGRVQKLVKPITEWQGTSSEGRQVAVVTEPVLLSQPTQQYAVRTPSKDRPDGYYYAVLFTTRLELTMQEVVDHYDDRAGMEADLKGDKHGLGLAVLRKHKLAAQKVVILLVELAHNVLVWSRSWLVKRVPRLESFGLVRLVQEVWAVPGRVKVIDDRLKRVRLHPDHPRVEDVSIGLSGLLSEGQTLGFLG